MFHFSFYLSINEFLAAADYFSTEEGTTLLFSGGKSDTAKHSYLSLFPFETIKIQGDILIHFKDTLEKTIEIINPWDGLQNHFFSFFEKEPDSYAFGWLSYEMGFSADSTYLFETKYSSITPDAYWQRCALQLIYHHDDQKCDVYIDSKNLPLVNDKHKHWVSQLASENGWRSLIKTHLFSPFAHETHAINTIHREEISPDKFIQKIKKAQEYIKNGDIYQVNLSEVFKIESIQNPFKLFKELCLNHPTPFAAFIKTNEMTIISMSPERFLCKKGDQLETRPIKGTIKRGLTPTADKELKEKLLVSEKERAELLMITDLMRNDLGKISQIGSVKTLEIWKCEAYSKVFHLVSIIQSLALNTLKPLEIVRSCFPGGSITGCPKLRSMEIIHELEDVPRGLYTGSIGYFKGSGDFDLNIAIRTLVIPHQGPSSIHLGSGIVYDSNPIEEFHEILAKGASFFESLQQESLKK